MPTTILSGEGDEFRRFDEVAELEAIKHDVEAIARRLFVGRNLLHGAVFGTTEAILPFDPPSTRALAGIYPYSSN